MLLTIVNLTAGVLPIQDPTGLSALSLSVPAGGTLANQSITIDQLSHLESVLNAEQTASRLTWSVKDDPASQADSLPEGIVTALVTPHAAAAGAMDIITNLTVAGAVSVVLSASAPIGKRVTVVDGKGDGATNNVTVTVAGGGTINGGANKVINANYGHMMFLKISATAWLLIA